ncbi:ATP-binding SpoIIE family protein phosphatase [Allostreptomyces psammosilenae]|uniref:PPM-type phosphatase domain-containing protein n=1 Tax=Allostreptomyces psammosilenae TaxID=1892865 RepID=A0A853A1C9_9ACTN|nr:ATP-binding SpoIIE family protein phosphatase [Allostreptomyces psammosilenae]NYI08179.1 hypothetical protein [Allostreptomyces psammosilenae]
MTTSEAGRSGRAGDVSGGDPAGRDASRPEASGGGRGVPRPRNRADAVHRPATPTAAVAGNPQRVRGGAGPAPRAGTAPDAGAETAHEADTTPDAEAAPDAHAEADAAGPDTAGAAELLRDVLLPAGTPGLVAVETAVAHRRAAAHGAVGGDWLDVIKLPGGRVGLVAGDVFGRGLRAAALMGQLRATVLSLAVLDMMPSLLLRHLDDVVHRLGSDSYATCLYAVYDPIAKECRVSSAGHQPPVLIRPGRSPESLPLPCGAPLGIGGVPFSTVTVPIPDGSLLALVTDPLSDVRVEYAAERAAAERAATERAAAVGGERAGVQDVPDAPGVPDKVEPTLLPDLLARLGEGLAVPPAAAGSWGGGPAGPAGGQAEPPPGLQPLCDATADALHAAEPADEVGVLLARLRGLPPSHVAGWQLALDPREVRRARSLTGGKLYDWGLEPFSATVELIVSELVTNAIRHAHRHHVELRLIRAGNLLVGEITDDNHDFPALVEWGGEREDGWGLRVVSRLATQWGSARGSTGKTVWFEVLLVPSEREEIEQP